jgi:cell division protein FtsL
MEEKIFIKQRKTISLPFFYLCVIFLIFAVLFINLFQNVKITTLKWEVTNIASYIKDEDDNLAFLDSKYAQQNSTMFIFSKLNKLGLEPGQVQVVCR